MSQPTIDLRSQVIWLDEDGIVHVKLKPHLHVGLADAMEAIQEITALCQGTKRPTVVDMTELRSMDRNARAYFAGPDTANTESAAALLVSSPLSHTIGNFFLGLNQTLFPTRLFRSEADAIAWLRQFLNHA